MFKPSTASSFFSVPAVLASVGVVLAQAEPSALRSTEGADRSAIDVVKAQMIALSQWREDAAAAKRVFDLASPANQSVTGPLKKFRSLVESKSYSPLIANRGWIVGRAVEADGVAAVLVTLVGEDDSLHSYRFYLSRHPMTGVWKTDAVMNLSPSFRFAKPANDKPA